MKISLALYHKILPATINVKKPNPKLNIENSAFYINTETRPWFRQKSDIPRRAGVSAFGFGGYALREVSINTNDQGPMPRMRAMAMSAKSEMADAPVPVEAGKSTVLVSISGSVQMLPLAARP